MKRTRTTMASMLAVAILCGCSSVSALDEAPGGGSPEPTGATSAVAPFDACESFLDYVISHGVELVGPYGLDGQVIWPWVTVDRAAAAEQAGSDGQAPATPTHSGTNVQVEGVDEPDIVKTDGKRLVMISEMDLIVVDVTGDEPVETGRMSLHDMSVSSLFLVDDKVLLFGSIWSGGVPGPMPLSDAIAPVPGTATMQIVAVDISDDPEIESTMTIDGSFVSGRMVGDVARLVLRSGPVGFEWSYPEGSGLKAEREAIEANQRIIRRSTEENWIPYYVATDADGDVTSEGTLFECDRAAHPEEFSGLDMLSVVTIDVSEGLEVVDATGLLATGETVYSSSDSLYMATQDWDTLRWMQTGEEDDRPDGPITAIHMFDISDPKVTSYVASGDVDGYLLNQFAMDEHEGVLRVASTTTPNWWGSAPESESRVTALRPIGTDLIRIGTVEGLGRTEQIYSVRFMGDVAYVVTFRQTDPLYTIDLSDPRNPAMAGELKIPGYSAYLHPIDAGLVLGVGQDATEDGVVKGTQVSVFDVSDLGDPRRVDTLTMGEGTSSTAEYDHHAFLFWEGTAVIPFQRWSWDGKDEGLMGAWGLAVDETGEIREVGQVVHPGGDGNDWDYRSQILRSIVVGDSLYTVSAKGVMKSDLESLETEAWLDF